MSTEATDNIEDRGIVYRDYFLAKQREYLRTLVCDEVIEEYKCKPLGQHSEPLERLLIYFRRLPLEGQFAVKRDTTTNTFRIIALSGQRGAPPTDVGEESYTSIEAAYHGVFLKHIENLMGT